MAAKGKQIRKESFARRKTPIYIEADTGKSCKNSNKQKRIHNNLH